MPAESRDRAGALLGAIGEAQALQAQRAGRERVFSRVLSELVALTGSEFGYINEAFVDAEGRQYVRMLSVTEVEVTGEAAGMKARMEAGESLYFDPGSMAGRALATGEVVIVNDAANQHGPRPKPDGHPEIRKFLGLPLKFCGEIVGVVGLANRSEGYTPEMAEELGPYLTTCAGILHGMRVQQQLEQRAGLLERSQERFRTLVEDLPGAVYRCEVEAPWRMDYMSRGIEKITGYAAEEYLVGRFKLFSDAIHEQDRAAVNAEVARCVAMDQPYELEYRLQAAGGGWRWIYERGRANRREAGEAEYLEGIFVDITEQREAREELRQSEAKYRLLVENQSDLVIEADMGWRLQYASPSYCRTFGKEPGELLDRPFMPLIHEEDRAAVEASLERLKEPPYETSHEERALTARGYRWFAWKAQAVRSAGGELSGYVSVGRDITERKRAEALQRDILDSLAAHMAVIDESGRVIAVNRAWRGYGLANGAGRAEDVCEGVDYLEACERGGEPEGLQAAEGIREVLRGETSMFRMGYGCITPQGRRWFQMTAAPLTGEVKGAVVAHEDLTAQHEAQLERERLNEELRQAQKLESLGRLAGGVAHDFNNLLTIINGYAELLLKRAGEGDAARGGLGQIQKAGERAAELARQLLLFSRREDYVARPVKLAATAREMETMLPRLLGDDIEVRIVDESEGASVSADAGRLQQVMMNLAANARDAMPAGGQLEVRLGGRRERERCEWCRRGLERGEYLSLIVSDNGAGMDGPTLERLFEPFYTTKRRGHGTGLGLATVHGIVTQAGGHICVRSRVGEGSEFGILWPASAEEAEEAAPAVAPVGGRERILLVEDQAEVRRYAADALKSLGYDVLEAADGQTALDLLESGERVDLMLTDVLMPRMGGRELARRALAMRSGLKVLYMSGYVGGERNGYEPFIAKPFEMKTLAAALRRALGQATDA